MRGLRESLQELSLDADGFRAQSATLSVSLTFFFFGNQISLFSILCFFFVLPFVVSLTEFLSVSISVCIPSVSFSVRLTLSLIFVGSRRQFRVDGS